MSHEPFGALLVIDQEPIRREATEELQDAYSSMRRMRRQIERFESVDKPAFARWLRTEFQSQLAEIAALQSKVAESEEIVAAVQMIRFATGCSYHQAYVNVMERRRSGLGFEDVFADEEGFEREADKGWDAFSRGEPKSDASGEDSHRDENDETDGETEGAGGRDRRGAGADGRASAGDDGDGPDEGLWGRIRRAAKGTAEIVKQRYRELARLLHPDLRSGGDSWSSELWHRTQAAYASGDLDELENILVLCRVSFQEGQGESNVSDMRAALGFIRKSIVALRRHISQLRQDMAWGFARLKDRTRLRRRIAYDLDYEHEELTVRFDEIEGQLARWSVPPARRSSGTRPASGRSRRRRSSAWDLDLDP